MIICVNNECSKQISFPFGLLYSSSVLYSLHSPWKGRRSFTETNSAGIRVQPRGRALRSNNWNSTFRRPAYSKDIYMVSYKALWLNNQLPSSQLSVKSGKMDRCTSRYSYRSPKSAARLWFAWKSHTGASFLRVQLPITRTRESWPPISIGM